MTKLPSIFIAHGAPPLLDDNEWSRELFSWAQSLPRPSAILMVSAHWDHAPLALGATRAIPLIYDFYGFPDRFYRITYPAPGAPALAERVRALLAPLGPIADEPARGLDHGVWVPLRAMYPEANVPVLQLSLPRPADPRALVAIGRALAPLRDEGVLVAGSGHLTHNLRRVDFGEHARTPSWASEFDAWVAGALARRDADALASFARAPGAAESLPTDEHYLPLLVAVGAALDSAGPVEFPITGFLAGSLSKRSVELW